MFSSPAHRKLWKSGRRKLWQNGKGCHLEHIQTLVEHPLWVRRKHFVYTALSSSCRAFSVATIPIWYMKKPRIEKATWPGWCRLHVAGPELDPNSLWLPNTFYVYSCLSTRHWAIILTDTGSTSGTYLFVSCTFRAWAESDFITVVTVEDVIPWITLSCEMPNS